MFAGLGLLIGNRVEFLSPVSRKTSCRSTLSCGPISSVDPVPKPSAITRYVTPLAELVVQTDPPEYSRSRLVFGSSIIRLRGKI